MLVDQELGEAESLDETLAAVHAWLVFVSREMKSLRRVAVVGTVAMIVCAVAAVVVAVVLVAEFGLT